MENVTVCTMGTMLKLVTQLCEPKICSVAFSGLIISLVDFTKLSGNNSVHSFVHQNDVSNGEEMSADQQIH